MKHMLRRKYFVGLILLTGLAVFALSHANPVLNAMEEKYPLAMYPIDKALSILGVMTHRNHDFFVEDAVAEVSLETKQMKIVARSSVGPMSYTGVLCDGDGYWNIDHQDIVVFNAENQLKERIRGDKLFSRIKRSNFLLREAGTGKVLDEVVETQMTVEDFRGLFFSPDKKWVVVQDKGQLYVLSVSGSDTADSILPEVCLTKTFVKWVSNEDLFFFIIPDEGCPMIGRGLYSWNTQKRKREFIRDFNDMDPSEVCFSHSGRYLAYWTSASKDVKSVKPPETLSTILLPENYFVNIYDLTKNEIVATRKVDCCGSDLCWNPDDTVIAVSLNGKKIGTFSLVDGTQKEYPAQGTVDFFQRKCFLSANHLLTCCAQDQFEMEIFDLATGKTECIKTKEKIPSSEALCSYSGRPGYAFLKVLRYKKNVIKVLTPTVFEMRCML